MTTRRLLENYGDIAGRMRFESVKRPLDGPFEEAGCRVADLDRVHIMAIQVPVGRGLLPESAVKLIRNTHSAVLVYKSNEQ